MQTETEKKLDAVEPSPAAGDDFTLSLVCPKCSATGWIEWKNLKHGIRCLKCSNQFLLGRNGQLLSHADLPHVRFSCPRCKKSGSIPSVLGVKRALCASCKLPLVSGPDHRLHGVKEAAELRRAANASAARVTFGQRLVAKFTTNEKHVFKVQLALWTTVTSVVLVGITALVLALLDNSPEKIARRFTYTCLTGRQAAAESYLEDDAVQLAEFNRWQVRYFPSIVDPIRPSGDRVEVTVAVLKDEPQYRVFEVTMKSPFIGTRSHHQHWRETDGNWQFDASETIREQEAAMRQAATAGSG